MATITLESKGKHLNANLLLHRAKMAVKSDRKICRETIIVLVNAFGIKPEQAMAILFDEVNLKSTRESLTFNWPVEEDE